MVIFADILQRRPFGGKQAGRSFWQIHSQKMVGGGEGVMGYMVCVKVCQGSETSSARVLFIAATSRTFLLMVFKVKQQ